MMNRIVPTVCTPELSDFMQENPITKNASAHNKMKKPPASINVIMIFLLQLRQDRCHQVLEVALDFLSNFYHFFMAEFVLQTSCKVGNGRNTQDLKA